MNWKKYLLLILFLLITNGLVFAGGTSRRSPSNPNISTFDSAGGKDYSDLGDWEAATDNDLVSAGASEILECYSGTHDVKETLQGATCSSSYYRLIRPESGSMHNGIPGEAGTVIFDLEGIYGGNLLTFNDTNGYSGMEDICLTITDADYTSAARALFNLTNNDNAVFVGILVYDCVNSGTGAAYGILTYGDAKWINCLVHNTDETGIVSRYANEWLNCTVEGVQSGAGFHNYEATPNQVAKNCISVNNPTDFSGNWTITTCCTTSVVFENAAGDDFHLDSTDSNCKNQGTDLEIGGESWDDDIDEDTRDANWDIGFDEYVSAGPSALPIQKRLLKGIHDIQVKEHNEEVYLYASLIPVVMQ